VLIIPTSRANIVLRVIWQRDRFGTTQAYLTELKNSRDRFAFVREIDDAASLVSEQKRAKSYHCCPRRKA